MPTVTRSCGSCGRVAFYRPSPFYLTNLRHVFKICVFLSTSWHVFFGMNTRIHPPHLWRFCSGDGTHMPIWTWWKYSWEAHVYFPGWHCQKTRLSRHGFVTCDRLGMSITDQVHLYGLGVKLVTLAWMPASKNPVYRFIHHWCVKLTEYLLCMLFLNQNTHGA